MTVTSAKVGSSYATDWYGEATLAHPPLSLTLTYDGNYSVSRTQTLHLWNWSTGAWVAVNQATVSTSDVTRTWSTNTPGDYVSPAGVVRCRVQANTRSKSYSCRADHMAFQYDYASGTVITVSPETYARLVPADWHQPYRDAAPQARLLAMSTSVVGDAVRLEWSTAPNEHMDGFNVYRQAADGTLEMIAHEADLETTSDDVRFGFTDASPLAGENLYWLAARSCAGDEGRVGPLRAVRSAALAGPTTLAFTAGPNPARGALRFALTLPAADEVRLDVFDLAGRLVASPLAGRFEAGAHAFEWDLAASAGGRVPAGLYFARLETAGQTRMLRLSVLDR